MKTIRVLITLALMALAASTLQADTKADKEMKEKMAKPDISATLEAKERMIQEAFKNRDIAGFNAQVDANGWAIDPSGIMAVSSVPEMMKQVEIRSYTIEGYKTMMIDPNVYVSTYTYNGDATMAGQPFPNGPWYCSTVWAKKGKDWKAVYHQETLSMQGMPAATASH